MNAAEAQQNRFNGTVAVFYNPITQVETREWDSIREFHGPFHPIIPDYRCDDIALLRKHLHWMRRAGIDVIVYDIYGFKAWNIWDIPRDSHSRALRLTLMQLGVCSVYYSSVSRDSITDRYLVHYARGTAWCGGKAF